jgi:hypothetical protein
MISDITRRAISRFEIVEKNLLNAERNEKILNELIVAIPAEDMPVYLAETAKILEKYQNARQRLGL